MMRQRQIREALTQVGFIDGKNTAGDRAKRVKHNLQLRRNAEGASDLERLILNALQRNTLFQHIAIPKKIQPPLTSRSEPGMEYGRHVDDAHMGKERKLRTDLSVTVFLSDPSDYAGGELVVQSFLDEQEVKLPAGAAVLYPSGALHRVAPVANGIRLAAITWVESYVRDPMRCETLHDLELIREKLAQACPDCEETDLA